MDRCNTSFKEVQPPSHSFFLHGIYFLQERLHFFKIVSPVSFFQMFHSYGSVNCIYICIYIYIRIYLWPVSFKKHYVHPRLLLHSNASLCYCMLFNQMIHSLVKEALHILAPKLSLRNVAINMLKWLLKGFHSEAMLSSFLKFLYFFNRTLHSWNSL